MARVVAHVDFYDNQTIYSYITYILLRGIDEDDTTVRWSPIRIYIYTRLVQ